MVRDMPPILLAGVGYHGTPDPGALEALRRRYEATAAALPGLRELLLEPELRYELRLADDETPTTGSFEVFHAQRVVGGALVPFELGVKLLPAAPSAVLTLGGDEAESDWERWLEAEWIPASPYLRSGTYVLLRTSSRGAVDAIVPLRPRR